MTARSPAKAGARLSKDGALDTWTPASAGEQD
jgi:hypothetical protein